MVYACCAGFSLLAGLLTLTIHYERRRSSEVATWGTVFAGVNFVWHDKLLLGAISLDLFAVLLGGATAPLPVYARAWIRLTKCVARFRRSIRFSSGHRIGLANSNRGRWQPRSVLRVLWSLAESVPCSSPSSGYVCFLNWPGVIACIEFGRLTQPESRLQ